MVHRSNPDGFRVPVLGIFTESRGGERAVCRVYARPASVSSLNSFLQQRQMLLNHLPNNRLIQHRAAVDKDIAQGRGWR
jgi:hypothetical protein